MGVGVWKSESESEGGWQGSAHREGGLVVVGVFGSPGDCVAWLGLTGEVSREVPR